MLASIYERQFKKEIEIAKKRGKNLTKLKNIMQLLLEDKPLPPKNRNHKLQGDFKDCWECHIEPDWLLIPIPRINCFLPPIRDGSARLLRVVGIRKIYFWNWYYLQKNLN